MAADPWNGPGGGVTEIETAMRTAALRFLSMADAEQDPLRRLGLLDLAGGAISAAKGHCVVEAGGVLRQHSEPDPEQVILEMGG
jgi:hypothetical protein